MNNHYNAVRAYELLVARGKRVASEILLRALESHFGHICLGDCGDDMDVRNALDECGVPSEESFMLTSYQLR